VIAQRLVEGKLIDGSATTITGKSIAEEAVKVYGLGDTEARQELEVEPDPQQPTRIGERPLLIDEVGSDRRHVQAGLLQPDAEHGIPRVARDGEVAGDAGGTRLTLGVTRQQHVDQALVEGAEQRLVPAQRQHGLHPLHIQHGAALLRAFDRSAVNTFIQLRDRTRGTDGEAWDIAIVKIHRDTAQLVLNFVSEHVLGLPRSY